MSFFHSAMAASNWPREAKSWALCSTFPRSLPKADLHNEQTLTVSMGFVNEMGEEKPSETAKACSTEWSRPSFKPCIGFRVLRSRGCRDGHLHHICCLRSLRALDDVELDVFSLLECFEPLALECGVMDKHILPAIQTNESKPLSIVEPLHSTFRLHKNPPFLNGHAMLRDRPDPLTLTDDTTEKK